MYSNLIKINVIIIFKTLSSWMSVLNVALGENISQKMVTVAVLTANTVFA